MGFWGADGDKVGDGLGIRKVMEVDVGLWMRMAAWRMEMFHTFEAGGDAWVGKGDLDGDGMERCDGNADEDGGDEAWTGIWMGKRMWTCRSMVFRDVLGSRTGDRHGEWVGFMRLVWRRGAWT
jgi:hypothetical protein